LGRAEQAQAIRTVVQAERNHMSKNYKARDKKLFKRKRGLRMDGKGMIRVRLDLAWRKKFLQEAPSDTA
jgi:hypothetical protein